MKRTHTCGELTDKNDGQTVTLAGWVQNRRDHGSLMFIDLRDRYGLTQIKFDLERPDVLRLGQEVRAEWVLQITGKVNKRPDDMLNPKLKTGAIEVAVDKFEVFSKSATLPFETDEHAKVGEETRLNYRYLDLRRPQMQHHLQVRHKVTQAMRQVLDSQGFLDIETPMLSKSTPEGARDYLVPSRVHPGEFYALPQSPQIFKQILMIAGCDRYYQIARCFRDEDLRADRQPEFTQLDLEMSFADQDDVFAVIEQCMQAAFKAGIDVDIPTPFPRMTYHEAMDKYGIDKPDLRFAVELRDVGAIVSQSQFKVFVDTLARGGIVKGLAAPGGAKFSRREMDVELLDIAKVFGAKGLAYIKVGDDGSFTGAPVKFFTPELLQQLTERLGGKPGDMLMFVADQPDIVNAGLAAVRNEVARRLDLIKPGTFAFSWITDFPAFEWSPEENRWTFSHNPFSAIHPDDMELVKTADLSKTCGLEKARSAAYDLVLNGVELASGSIRIHDSELQQRVFEIMRLSEEDIKIRFGFFVEALKYGTPPHAGIAPGLDRLIAMMLELDNIREVIAFPKTAKAMDLMAGAPSTVEAKQLKELQIASTVKKE